MPSAQETHNKFLHLADVATRPSYLMIWERQRHKSAHWFIEMVGEAVGVFMFVFVGVGTDMALGVSNINKETGVSSLLSVGIAYFVGIALAVATCASASGGHFSPAVTVCFTLFKGFPPLKAARYIFAQILGAYIACLLVYAQYYDLIQAAEKTLAQAGVWETVNFTPNGMAGVFAVYTTNSLKHVFLNEFVCDFVIGMVVWAALDPTNFFVSPILIPWAIAGAYLIVIIGFAPVGLAANPARDIGGRLAAISIWGLRASGGRYAAITALTGIPATIVAFVCYEIFFTDSSRVITPAHREFMEGHQAHMEHRQNEVYDVNGSFMEEEKTTKTRKIRA